MTKTLEEWKVYAQNNATDSVEVAAILKDWAEQDQGLTEKLNNILAPNKG